ncbi:MULTISPECIES: hypothetical protein [Oxalobacteraceae]|nr:MULTISPECIES: hypothetical protein [Oxalobacteraceae]
MDGVGTGFHLKIACKRQISFPGSAKLDFLYKPGVEEIFKQLLSKNEFN